MKRCRNCWTDNPDSAERCQKCGVPLNNKSWLNNENFRLDIRAVIGGLVTAVILSVIGYFMFGASNTFAFGMIPIPFAAGCVTTVLAYRKEANTSNSLLNSMVTGFIIGISVVAGIYAAGDYLAGITMDPLILIWIPSLAALTFLGGKLGTVINVAIENGKKSTILIATILITVIALAGYGIYQFELYASYDNGAYGLSYDLDFMDIIQPEADAYLIAPYNASEQRINNLKIAKVKYERMVNISNAAKPQSDEMIGNSSSSIREEYAKAMGQYLQLKHQYCTEMYTGIQSEINGNAENAQKHYQNAQNLIPQIQSQNAQILVIINKDQSFKSYITGKIDEAKEYTEAHKAENMTFYLG
jgi:hypothetical protein